MCLFRSLRHSMVRAAWAYRLRHETHRLEASEHRVRYSPSILMSEYTRCIRGLRSYPCPCKECSPPCPIPPT